MSYNQKFWHKNTLMIKKILLNEKCTLYTYINVKKDGFKNIRHHIVRTKDFYLIMYEYITEKTDTFIDYILNKMFLLFTF